MTTNQEGVHAAVRASTGTARDYRSDWHALFDAAGIASGPWGARFIAWANIQLGASYSNLNEAKAAYAINQGVARWNDLATITADSGPTGDGILLVDGTSFLLATNGDYIILS